jgi:RNA polymerase sigma factor (TIGR02999 family)
VLARRQLARGASKTLQTTAVVHEAYVKLVDSSGLRFADRGHFYAVASKAMRQILVDRARRRAAQKRGGDRVRVDLDENRVPIEERAAEILAVDQALTRLEKLDPRLVRIVEMRFFTGLSVEETAEAVESSPSTVKRDWKKARAFLYRELATAV